MKLRTLFISIAALGTLASVQSCLDYDMPGDTFRDTEQNVDKVVTRGAVDSIPYTSVYTVEEVTKASEVLVPYLENAIGAQYSMRGGKQGAMPGAHAYQYQFSLGTDVYSGYFVTPHSTFTYGGFTIPSSYYIEPKAYGGAYSSFNGNIATSVVPLLNHSAVDTIPELKAIFLLFYDYSAIEVADIYGPMPYNEIKTNKQTSPYTYETLETIYDDVEANIDTIVNCLKYYVTKPQEYRVAANEMLSLSLRVFNDNMVYGKDFIESLESAWRFANSLKLRMAMHLTKVNPSKAQKWAEEAVASGVIEDIKHEAGLRGMYNGFTHPLVDISKSWGDTRLGASFECILNSFNHPYLKTLFKPNGGAIINNKTQEVLDAETRVVGIRTGTYVGEGQGADENQYINFSGINYESMGYAPLYLMKISEVYFLRAEGALRGWNMGGTAQEFYELGIRYGNCGERDLDEGTFYESDPEHPVGMVTIYNNAMDEYLQLEKAIPYTYKDPTGDTPDVDSPITIGVKWNEGDDREVKLEKIITQKYIAGFPYSFEAFVDFRRTGYPRMLDVLNVEDSDGSIEDGEIIRRLPFPSRQDAATMQDIEATGLEALGGADEVGTRLWWDAETPNF